MSSLFSQAVNLSRRTGPVLSHGEGHAGSQVRPLESHQRKFEPRGVKGDLAVSPGVKSFLGCRLSVPNWDRLDHSS